MAFLNCQQGQKLTIKSLVNGGAVGGACHQYEDYFARITCPGTANTFILQHESFYSISLMVPRHRRIRKKRNGKDQNTKNNSIYGLVILSTDERILLGLFLFEISVSHNHEIEKIQCTVLWGSTIKPRITKEAFVKQTTMSTDT